MKIVCHCITHSDDTICSRYITAFGAKDLKQQGVTDEVAVQKELETILSTGALTKKAAIPTLGASPPLHTEPHFPSV